MKPHGSGAEYLYVVHVQFRGVHLDAWNDWYSKTHVPEVLTVPGFISADRYGHLEQPDRFVSIYKIASPAAFAHPRYEEVRGWAHWADDIGDFQRGLYQRLDDPPSWGS